MIIYLGYLILYLAFIRLCVTFVNFVSYLNLPKTTKVANEPFVSILIPVRNEEVNIANILNDLKHISYNNYEILICNDGSTDNTTTVVKKHIKTNPKIRLIEGLPLEEGWMGKSFACKQLATSASGQYYLFLDADVRIGANLPERAICHMQKYKIGLLSIFPKQIMDNSGAWLSVPLMNRILLSLLPLILVRLSQWVSFSAANGQFMMFDAKVYDTMQPHTKVKTDKAEDIAICQYFKKNKIRTSTLLGDSDIECNMYGSLKDAVNGFSKNVVAFFGNSVAATVLYTAFTSFAPLVIYFIFGFNIAVAYLASVSVMQILISAASRQNILKNLILLPLQQIVFIYIVFNALNSRTLTWKGRNIN